jgi:hypothetical protein
MASDSHHFDEEQDPDPDHINGPAKSEKRDPDPDQRIHNPPI